MCDNITNVYYKKKFNFPSCQIHRFSLFLVYVHPSTWHEWLFALLPSRIVWGKALATYWHTQKNNEFSYSKSSTLRKCGWWIIEHSFPFSILRFAISYPELNTHLSETFQYVLCRSRTTPTRNRMGENEKFIELFLSCHPHTPTKSKTH